MRKFKLTKEYPFSSEIGYICVNPIEDLSKFPEYWIELIEKSPIFISADGKDMFEGDKYYVTRINSDFELNGLCSVLIVDIYCKATTNKFSTKELAQEYIDNNKPKYSLEDIKSIWFSDKTEVWGDFENELKKIGK